MDKSREIYTCFVFLFRNLRTSLIPHPGAAAVGGGVVLFGGIKNSEPCAVGADSSEEIPDFHIPKHSSAALFTGEFVCIRRNKQCGAYFPDVGNFYAAIGSIRHYFYLIFVVGGIAGIF